MGKDQGSVARACVRSADLSHAVCSRGQDNKEHSTWSLSSSSSQSKKGDGYITVYNRAC